MATLAYYTIGYSRSFLEPLALSIHSLRHFSPTITVWVICDDNLVDDVRAKIPDIRVCPRSRAKTPEEASMQKLSIFAEDLSEFEKILYIDSDILVGCDVRPLLDGVVNKEKLYVYPEFPEMRWHNHIFFSLENYTTTDIAFFRENNIMGFNAGLFAFIPSDTMRNAFEGTQEMIRTHRGKFFYEQSFMNVYFNKRAMVDYSVFNKSNYTMHANLSSPANTLLHFCGVPGDGSNKISRMTAFAMRHLPYLLT